MARNGKWISDIQNGWSIWNGQKCDPKWFSDIQNGRRKKKFCINLKWPELRWKVNFGNPKWKNFSKIQIVVLIWNGKKCDTKWFLDIQNGYRRPFLKKHLQKKLREWFEECSNRLLADYNLIYIHFWSIYIYKQTAMLGTREYTLCSPFRANAHNSSYSLIFEAYYIQLVHM